MGGAIPVLAYDKPVGSDSLGAQWELQQPIPAYSGIVTVNSTVGILSDALRAVTIPIPSGAAILVKSVNVQVLAGAVNQILFSIGNITPLTQWFRVNAQNFATLGIIPINEILLAPFCFVDLSNISNTTFPGASGVGVNLQCIVSVDAVLLGERKRASLQIPSNTPQLKPGHVWRGNVGSLPRV